MGCVLTSKFTNKRITDVPHKVFKGEMPSFLKLLFEVVHKGVLPKDKRRHEAIFHDIGITH